jgi:competence protein ComEC
MAAALAVGIAAADWLRPHPAVALAALFASAVCGLASRRRPAAALLLTVALTGTFRYAYVETAGRGDLGAWEGKKVAVTATVTGEPELKQPRGVAYEVDVEQVDGHPAAGRLYVTQRGGRAPGFGERVVLTGTPKPPSGPKYPGGFDQAAVLARQSIYLTLEAGEARLLGPGRLNPVQRAAVAVRIRLEGVLKATLPPDQAGLMAGLLFGSRTEIPDDVKAAFKASGVLHLLAVSGGNLAMVILPLLGLLYRAGVPRRWAAVMGLGGVVFFVLLTGASPSVMRAGFMAGLVLVGDLLGRERNAVNTLGAAAFLLLLAWPGLLFDLGFQLSAGATLGILLLARPIERWLAPQLQAVFGEKAGGWLAAGLSVTFAAQALVEPISLHSFGATSTIAPVANLLVLGFLEPLVQVGSVAALLGLAFLPAARLINWVVRLGLWLLVFTVKATAAVPGAYLQVGSPPLGLVAAWYAGLAVVAWAPLRAFLRERLAGAAGQARRWAAAGGWRGTRAAVIVAVTLVVTAGLAGVWRAAAAGPGEILQVTFLDIGQGDAILIEAPGGQAMLVDAGPAVRPDPRSGRPGYDAGADVVLPALSDRGIRRLEYLLLTHPDQDHAGGGAAVLEGIPVSTLLRSGEDPNVKGYTEALAIAAAKHIPVRGPVAGERILLGPEVALDVLNPPPVPYTGTRSDTNSNCVVLRLRYRLVSMLLTCDMEAGVEADLLAGGTDLRADVLKVAHHGSGASSTAAFLAAVQPTLAVVSAGNGNPYGHPHAETLERLRTVGTRIFRTDRQGDITVRTDGRTLTATGARPDTSAGPDRPLGILGRRPLFAW